MLQHTTVAHDGVDGDAAVAADAPVQASEPVVLGPKTFPTADHCFRYFSGLLTAMTCHQDCNEVRRASRLSCTKLGAPRVAAAACPNASTPQYERLVLEPLLMRGHPSAASKARPRAFGARDTVLLTCCALRRLALACARSRCGSTRSTAAAASSWSVRTAAPRTFRTASAQRRCFQELRPTRRRCAAASAAKAAPSAAEAAVTVRHGALPEASREAAALEAGAAQRAERTRRQGKAGAQGAAAVALAAAVAPRVGAAHAGAAADAADVAAWHA